MLKQRSILGYIGLNLITLGFYSIYWVYAMTRDMNQLCEDGQETSPLVAVILTVVTFGIYSYVWYFQFGNRMQNRGLVQGVQIKESGITYILWMTIGIFLLGLGPIIGMYKFLKNYSNLVTIYNHKLVKNAV